MFTTSRRMLTALLTVVVCALLTAVGSLVATAPVHAANAKALTALSATDAVSLLTDDKGILRFDVAENGKVFVVDNQPTFPDGQPTRGTTYISQGYIYPVGTLSADHDGVNADGSPEFPDQVVGQWSCYGWYVGEGAHTTTGPWIISTQLYNFGAGWGEASLVSDGYLLADVGLEVTRAVTGGTGPFAALRGELLTTNLGFNETGGGNARYVLRPAQ